MGSIAVVHRLSCSTACGIFPDHGLNCVSCTGRQILYHWANKETWTWLFNKHKLYIPFSLFLSSINISILFLLSSLHLVISLRERVAEGLGVIDTQRFWWAAIWRNIGLYIHLLINLLAVVIWRSLCAKTSAIDLQSWPRNRTFVSYTICIGR